MAFSIRATFKLKGQTIPALSQRSELTTLSFTFGSKAIVSFLLKIFNPLQLLFIPLLYKDSICLCSSSLKANTSEPICLKSTLNSSHNFGYNSLPLTFNLAFKLPSFASYPPWTIALFDFVVP